MSSRGLRQRAPSRVGGDRLHQGDADGGRRIGGDLRADEGVGRTDSGQQPGDGLAEHDVRQLEEALLLAVGGLDVGRQLAPVRRQLRQQRRTTVAAIPASDPAASPADRPATTMASRTSASGRVARCIGIASIGERRGVTGALPPRRRPNRVTAGCRMCNGPAAGPGRQVKESASTSAFSASSHAFASRPQRRCASQGVRLQTGHFEESALIRVSSGWGFQGAGRAFERSWVLLANAASLPAVTPHDRSRKFVRRVPT